jgi:hypothetical protein
MENSNNKIELVDKIIHFAEKAIYYVLSILILLFLAFEIVNLVHLFYVEVSEAYISGRDNLSRPDFLPQ